MGLLDGRSVVVTGAGRGLGRAFAIAVAEAGAAVVVNDVDVGEATSVSDEIEKLGGRAVASGASVADWQAAGDLIETSVRSFGRIDGLVNNAVAYPFFGEPWNEEGPEIQRAVDVNVTGALYCGVHAMRRMREQGSGSIVNLASRSMQGIPGAATYGATKGALASVTYSWALDMKPHGVRVNGLAPAAKTRAHEMSASVGSYANRDAVSPDRIAPAAVFLLSDLAEGVTGQILALIGTKLGVVRPVEVIQLAEREDWAPEAIAEMFRGEHLQPVGLAAALVDRGSEG